MYLNHREIKLQRVNQFLMSIQKKYIYFIYIGKYDCQYECYMSLVTILYTDTDVF